MNFNLHHDVKRDTILSWSSTRGFSQVDMNQELDVILGKSIFDINCSDEVLIRKYLDFTDAS